jgi:hypothetical protein
VLQERWADAADYAFYLHLIHGRIVERFPEPLVRFRVHQQSTTGQRDARQQEPMQIRLRWARGPATGRSSAASTRSSGRYCRASPAGPGPYDAVRSRGAAPAE